MRALVALALVAASPLRPPVIHEPWTPLACPSHATTTVAIEGCLERDVTRGDRAIDGRAAAIFGLLRGRRDRAGFVAGERAWLTYRRASCRAASSAYAGGTMAPVAFLQCEAHANARHLADLADVERTLKRP